MQRRYRSAAGFTLVELVVIMVIVGVLAVFVTSRVSDQADFSARGYFDELVSASRFAQRYALASGCTVRIQINASDYSVTSQDADCGIGTTIQAPTGGNFAGTAPSGINVTGGTGNYHFNALGDTVDAVGNPGSGGTIQVQGGGNTHTFTITPVTGFVDTP